MNLCASKIAPVSIHRIADAFAVSILTLIR